MTDTKDEFYSQYTSINKVELNEHFNKETHNYNYEFKGKYLGPFSTINVFIGRNNSGKSQFMRNLLLKKFVSAEVNYIDRPILLEHLKALLNHFDSIFEKTNTISNKNLRIGGYGNRDNQRYEINIGMDELNDLYNRVDDKFEPILVAQELHNDIQNLIDAHEIWYTIAKKKIDTSAYYPPDEKKEIFERTKSIALSIKKPYQLLTDSKVSRSSESPTKKFYIPMIRGMRPLIERPEDRSIKAPNYYQVRTKTDYFEDADLSGGSIEIFTGLELYEKLQHLLLGQPDGREWVRQYEKILSEYFFDEKPVSLIPEMGKDTVSIKIGDEDQFPIYHLGDGLQTIIIMTFNAYTEQKRCLFFMEEPDLCLHPGQQRTLIQFLLKECPKHQYFLTTHSNHLLELSLDFDDISIFSMNKQFNSEKQSSDKPPTIFKIKNLSSKDFNILSELGVRNSSVMLSNATIWVEGITDRYYLRSYMKKFANENQDKNEDLSKLKEDYHYSFVEYQGSTLDHWTWDTKDEGVKKIQATKVCASSVLVADGDIESKGNRKKEYEKMFGKRQFIVLNCKEIENLVPEEVLKEYLKGETGASSKQKEIASIVREEYQAKDEDNEFVGLGAYLNSKLKLTKYCDTDSGTIKNKKAFCEKTTKFMDTRDDWNLPSDVKEICKKIYKHILKQNGYNTSL